MSNNHLVNTHRVATRDLLLMCIAGCTLSQMARNTGMSRTGVYTRLKRIGVYGNIKKGRKK